MYSGCWLVNNTDECWSGLWDSSDDIGVSGSFTCGTSAYAHKLMVDLWWYKKCYCTELWGLTVASTLCDIWVKTCSLSMTFKLLWEVWHRQHVPKEGSLAYLMYSWREGFLLAIILISCGNTPLLMLPRFLTLEETSRCVPALVSNIASIKQHAPSFQS